MKIIHAFVIALIVSSIIGCGRTQDQSADKAAIKAVKPLVQKFTTVLASGDTTSFFSFLPTYLDENVEYMPPNEPRIAGEQVREWFQGFLRQFVVVVKFSDEEFFAGGDWAFHRYTYELTATPKSGGAPMTEKGNGVHIFHRQADGSWKLAKDVWSSV